MAKSMKEDEQNSSGSCGTAARPHYMISYTTHSLEARQIAKTLYYELSRRKVRGKPCRVWWDKRERDVSEASMKRAAERCHTFIAILSGPCQSPAVPARPEAENAYFRRSWCEKEIRWRLESRYSDDIVLLADEKEHTNIGALIATCPRDLHYLFDDFTVHRPAMHSPAFLETTMKVFFPDATL